MAWSNIGGGGGENVSAEVARQKQLLDEMESLYKGKTTGADATAEDILEGKKAYVGRQLITGTHPDVTAEVEEQTPLVQQIRESIVGKATLANATPDKIVKGYSAYVGQELVNGTLEPLSMQDVAEMFGFSKISVDTFTLASNTKASTYSVQHSLGEYPKFAFLNSNNAEYVAGYNILKNATMVLNGQSGYRTVSTGYFAASGGAYSLGGYKGSSSNNTEETIVFYDDTVWYKSGAEYTVITMA